VRRILLIALPLAVLVALIGATGQRADGRITSQPPLGPASRVLPSLTAAQAATHHRSPLSFTIVDTAGAVVHRWPGGPVSGTIAATTPLGSHSWNWALSTSRDHRWARVALTWKPNGRSGWIRLTGRHRVHTPYWVKADLSQRSLRLMKGRRPLVVFKAAVGTPSTPTPTGKFFVTDLVATGDPSGPFGWFAFGLSGHQPNLPAGWSGGDQLAIHGTNAPSSIGTAASAGCLRVSAAALGTLRRYLRLGTPVVIQR
jgi:lipoprotein-anchoring transpeptidase ErfK/SrfK